jgi:crotonobetainyl-CoA:carnitine CoA-transferase CaiB-like acyl-CoA transferase
VVTDTRGGGNAGALDGVRVLDFTQMMLGPYGTQMLADLGADVIKVERAGTGEWARGLELMGDLVAGDSAAFLAMNRNKRSIAVDLRVPEVKEALLKLGAKCDVVVENFRPGVLDRIGLGYKDFKDRRPDIIFCSGSGWGQRTRFAQEKRPGQDLLIQSMSGLALNTGRLEDPPTAAGTSICDASTALTLAVAVLAALYARERQGIGQWVEVDLFSTTMAILCQEISAMVNQQTDVQRSRAGIAQPWLSAPFGIYATADGWFALSMTPLEVLAPLVDMPDLPDLDPWVDRDEIKERLDGVFVERKTQQWVDALLEAGIWCAPVRSMKEAVDELRDEGSDLLIRVEHPRAGTLELIGCPITLGETPWTLRFPPPLVGEHTDEVLGEVLESHEINALRESGAVS